MSPNTTQEPDTISHIAERVGHRWFSSSAADWGRYAWRLLAEAGTVPARLDETHPNYPDHVVTAAALAFLSDSFEDCELPDGDVEPPDVRELIDDVALGRHAERVNVYSSEIPESPAELASLVVRDRMPAVARSLAREIGQVQLFADLWVQRMTVTDGYPLDDELVDHIVNTLTPEKLIAWEWLDRLLPVSDSSRSRSWSWGAFSLHAKKNRR